MVDDPTSPSRPLLLLAIRDTLGLRVFRSVHFAFSKRDSSSLHFRFHSIR